MSFIGKVYNFVSQENLEEFLKGIGLPEDKIQGGLKFTPSQKIEKNGDTYTFYTLSDVAPKQTSFKSGVEFEDTVGAENIPAKSTFTVDGNTVTQTITTPQFGTATVIREYNGDDLVITISSDKWNGSAKRFYKA